MLVAALLPAPAGVAEEQRVERFEALPDLHGAGPDPWFVASRGPDGFQAQLQAPRPPPMDACVTVLVHLVARCDGRMLIPEGGEGILHIAGPAIAVMDGVTAWSGLRPWQGSSVNEVSTCFLRAASAGALLPFSDKSGTPGLSVSCTHTKYPWGGFPRVLQGGQRDGGRPGGGVLVHLVT